MRPRLTRHGRKKVRKRIGTKNERRLFNEALRLGLRPSASLPPILRRYFAALEKHGKAALIHLNCAWIYVPGKKPLLITTHPIPTKLHKFTRAALENRETDS